MIVASSDHNVEKIAKQFIDTQNVFLWRISLAESPGQQCLVRFGDEEHGKRRVSVAPRTSGLLIILFKR